MSMEKAFSPPEMQMVTFNVGNNLNGLTCSNASFLGSKARWVFV